MFGSGGRLRVNMGNVYYEQRKYPLAIKHYRMALDQIPDAHRRMRLRYVPKITWYNYYWQYINYNRFKILQNICTVFVKMGQYNDAINTYEHIHNELKDTVDFRTGQ